MNRPDRKHCWHRVINHLSAPRDAGCYAIYSDGKLLYLGCALNLKERLATDPLADEPWRARAGSQDWHVPERSHQAAAERQGRGSVQDRAVPDSSPQTARKHPMIGLFSATLGRVGSLYHPSHKRDCSDSCQLVKNIGLFLSTARSVSLFHLLHPLWRKGLAQVSFGVMKQFHCYMVHN